MCQTAQAEECNDGNGAPPPCKEQAAAGVQARLNRARGGCGSPGQVDANPHRSGCCGAQGFCIRSGVRSKGLLHLVYLGTCGATCSSGPKLERNLPADALSIPSCDRPKRTAADYPLSFHLEKAKPVQQHARSRRSPLPTPPTSVLQSATCQALPAPQTRLSALPEHTSCTSPPGPGAGEAWLASGSTSRHPVETHRRVLGSAPGGGEVPGEQAPAAAVDCSAAAEYHPRTRRTPPSLQVSCPCRRRRAQQLLAGHTVLPSMSTTSDPLSASTGSDAALLGLAAAAASCPRRQRLCSEGRNACRVPGCTEELIGAYNQSEGGHGAGRIPRREWRSRQIPARLPSPAHA